MSYNGRESNSNEKFVLESIIRDSKQMHRSKEVAVYIVRFFAYDLLVGID